MSKISNELKRKVKENSTMFPVYMERMGKRVLITKQDAQVDYGISSDQLNQIGTLTKVHNNAGRLIDASVHEKRWLNMIKKNPDKGYRMYMEKMDKLEFGKMDIIDRIKGWFGVHF